MDTTQKVGPKDIFLHLLSIITLYASAISLATLLFQYINLHFPEAYSYRDGVLSTIRFAVSTLIVVFPVYFWSARTLRRATEADPTRLGFGIRKGLGYFTLFLAGSIAIGWLIAVINKFLEGDFTTAFILKALVIFFVTGSMFFYYRAVTRGAEAAAGIRYFGWFIAAVVLASIIGAFVIVGSPNERRLQKADAQRVNDLRSIQYQIGSYYQNKKQLPASLEDLKGAFGDQTTPKDPATQANYEYVKGDGNSFELCATFAEASNTQSGEGTDLSLPAYPVGSSYYGPEGDSWKHGAGRQCFKRTLDPSYFNAVPAPLPVK